MSTIKVNALRHTGGSSDNINLDSSGRVLVGTSSAINVFGYTNAGFQVAGAGDPSAINSVRYDNSQYANAVNIAKSRGASVGTNTIVQNNDVIGQINFAGADGTAFIPAADISAEVDGTPGTDDMPGRLVFSTTADGASSPTEAMRIDSSQNLRFNSGYGSVATAYGVRVWANINGTGTIAIRDSGNVSSITDNGTGQYTFTFTNNLPDANYSFVFTGNQDTPNSGSIVSAPADSANSTSSIRCVCVNHAGSNIDMKFLSLVIVR